MKVNFLCVLLALSLVGVLVPASTAHAQEKGLSPNDQVDANHSEMSSPEDRSTLADHELKLRAISRDSSQMHTRIAPTSTRMHRSKPMEHKSTASHEEEDALSFNFLYYIIQKYKFSDLIDE